MNIKIEDLDSKFEKLFSNLQKDKFLSMDALGGEIPFYIVPYSPAQHNDAAAREKQLRHRLQKEGIEVFEIDLYDLSLQLLQQRGVLDKILQKESTIGKRKLFKTLHSVLDPQTKLVEAIEQKVQENPSHILFLTGIGQVYPYIRSHTILNNLQNRIKDRPTVMFFPGRYGKELSLFGRMQDDNYYRAFNLDTLNL